MPATEYPPTLVSVPREQYLRKAEPRILEAARELVKTGDPSACNHILAIDFATDLFDIHDIASTRYRRQNNDRVAAAHDQFKFKAQQLRFYHLDQLAHLAL